MTCGSLLALEYYLDEHTTYRAKFLVLKVGCGLPLWQARERVCGAGEHAFLLCVLPRLIPAWFVVQSQQAEQAGRLQEAAGYLRQALESVDEDSEEAL